MAWGNNSADGKVVAGAQAGEILDLLAAVMGVEGLGDLVGERFDFGLRPLGMELDPAVGEVLDIAGNVISTGQTEDLGTKTDPLDMSDIPDSAMGDMG